MYDALCSFFLLSILLSCVLFPESNPAMTVTTVNMVTKEGTLLSVTDSHLFSRSWGELEPFPANTGHGLGTLWTGRQSITGPHRDKQRTDRHTLTFTHYGQFIVAKILERREPTWTERTCLYEEARVLPAS